MAWYDRMLSLDRRWIYLILAVAVLVPLIVPMHLPVGVSSEVRAVYDFVDQVRDGQVMHLALEYDPSTMAELHPMAEAILRKVFEQNGRLIMSSLSQFGPAMADELIQRIAREYHKRSGIDYVFLGYKPYPAITILAMGTDYRVPFPVDYYGAEVDTLPLMAGIRNFDDVRGVVGLCGGNAADMWITYGNAKYGMPLALGVTGVMAADYYQYLQAGQLFGLIPGIKGAAEFEQLTGRTGEGARGIPYQTASHAVVLFFIIATNIAYFAKRSAERRAGALR